MGVASHDGHRDRVHLRFGPARSLFLPQYFAACENICDVIFTIPGAASYGMRLFCFCTSAVAIRRLASSGSMSASL